MISRIERFAHVNCDISRELHGMLLQNGKIVSLLSRLCWNREMNWNLRVPGFYCFAEQTNKVLDPFIFLYVGRTRDLHKRFCEHKHRWLMNYVLKYPKSHLWYGYILEENIPQDFGTVGYLEKMCWRNEKELGLVREQQLYKETT